MQKHPSEVRSLTYLEAALLGIASGAHWHHFTTAWVTDMQVAVTALSSPQIGNRKLAGNLKLFQKGLCRWRALLVSVRFPAGVRGAGAGGFGFQCAFLLRLPVQRLLLY